MTKSGFKGTVDKRVNIGLVNVRSWRAGILEEICKENENCNLNLLAVTQTTLWGNIDEYYKDYRMVGKGREIFL